MLYYTMIGLFFYSKNVKHRFVLVYLHTRFLRVPGECVDSDVDDEGHTVSLMLLEKNRPHSSSIEPFGGCGIAWLIFLCWIMRRVTHEGEPRKQTAFRSTV
jgi:hypothetical protein